MAVFMLVNIYMIETPAWDLQGSEEQVAPATSEEDYALAETLEITDGTVTGHQNNRLAIYHIHNHLTMDELPLPTDYDWIIVQKKQVALEKKNYPEPRSENLATLQRIEQVGSTHHNKIYESRNLALFSFRPMQE